MTLADLCALVAGRVPLVIEVKSHFDGDRKLVTRMAEVLSSYAGPAVGMSFDPDQVMALRELHRRRGRAASSPSATTPQRIGRKPRPRSGSEMTHLRHFFRTRPDFVAYWVNELPSAAPWLARNLFGCPLLTWTVRTPEQRARAARHADQMIFEGFVPGT